MEKTKQMKRNGWRARNELQLSRGPAAPECKKAAARACNDNLRRCKRPAPKTYYPNHSEIIPKKQIKKWNERSRVLRELAVIICLKGGLSCILDFESGPDGPAPGPLRDQACEESVDGRKNSAP